MTHIAHVAQPTTEGVARCVVSLTRHQVAQGHQVTVVCPEEGWLAAEALASGAAHRAWAAKRSPNHRVPAETATLRHVLQRLAPDIVHLHSAKAGLAGRLAVRGALPTVYQPHAWSFLAAHGPVRAASLAWERWAVRWVEAIVCVSEAELRDGSAAGLRLDGRAWVVPNGVDTDHFAPQDRVDARRRLKIENGPMAVCIGRLSEQKGQDVLLRAWPAVRRQFPTARLVLLGEGPWRERLERMAGEGASLLGRSEDPRDWYAAADVVVVPSRWEGMALVPLEAAASARSVVMTDVAGAREAVPPGTGEVVPREDPASLAAALVRRLADPALAAQEGQAARRHVLSSYALAVNGTRMEQVYESFLSDKTGPSR